MKGRMSLSFAITSLRSLLGRHPQLWPAPNLMYVFPLELVIASTNVVL